MGSDTKLFLTICPVRAWELEYDTANKEYSFIAFDGGRMVISGHEVYLWEMASGKNTIEEILTDETSPLKFNSDTLSMTLEFYSKLEKKYALLFRKY